MKTMTFILPAHWASALINGKPGEGIVIRAMDSSWSFKAINLNYKD